MPAAGATTGPVLSAPPDPPTLPFVVFFTLLFALTPTLAAADDDKGVGWRNEGRKSWRLL